METSSWRREDLGLGRARCRRMVILLSVPCSERVDLAADPAQAALGGCCPLARPFGCGDAPAQLALDRNSGWATAFAMMVAGFGCDIELVDCRGPSMATASLG